MKHVLICANFRVSFSKRTKLLSTDQSGDSRDFYDFAIGQITGP